MRGPRYWLFQVGIPNNMTYAPNVPSIAATVPHTSHHHTSPQNRHVARHTYTHTTLHTYQTRPAKTMAKSQQHLHMTAAVAWFKKRVDDMMDDMYEDDSEDEVTALVAEQRRGVLMQQAQADSEALVVYFKRYLTPQKPRRFALRRGRNRGSWRPWMGRGMSDANDAASNTRRGLFFPQGVYHYLATRPLSAAGQMYKQTDRFVYLGRTICAVGKADREITSRSCRAWKCYRRYSASMFDRRRADRQLKIRLLQAEVVETLLYGCASWSLTAEYYTKLNGTHRQFLTRCIGCSKRKRLDRLLSCAQALIQAGCEETIEATVRKRRLCFAGFVMRMEVNRLPKRMLLGAMAGGMGYLGGQDSDWVSRLGEDLVAFNMGDDKKEGKWKESAKDPEVWCNKVENGAAWFTRKWHRQEAEASAKRQRAGEAEAESTAISGPKRKKSGKRRWGGRNGDRALL
ncbi:unnamed protein product [Ectocarpus sp. 13 AM-2016]